MGTLLNRRRYMGGAKGLPYDVEVEYLEADGAERIVTDIISSSSMAYETKYGFDAVSKRTFLFGIYGGTGGGYVAVAANGKYEPASLNVVLANGIHELYFSNSESIIDGNTYAAKGDLFRDRPTWPITIFQYQKDQLTGGVQRIYYFSAYNNGVKVNELMPVRIGQVGYLYDKISGTLYANNGTGTLTLGPDKT